MSVKCPACERDVRLDGLTPDVMEFHVINPKAAVLSMCFGSGRTVEATKASLEATRTKIEKKTKSQ
jgi:hypothetical protein